MFVIFYIIGCFAGASVKYNADWVLFLAFGVKMLICVTFLFTPGMVTDLEMQDDKPASFSHILWGD